MTNKINNINEHDKQKINSGNLGVACGLILQLFISCLIHILEFDIMAQVLVIALTLFNIGITQIINYDKVADFVLDSYYTEIHNQLLKGRNGYCLIPAKFILKCIKNTKYRANFLVILYLSLKILFIIIFVLNIFFLNIHYIIYILILLLLIILNIIIHSLGYWSLREHHYLSKYFFFFFDPLPGKHQIYGRFDMIYALQKDETHISQKNKETFKTFYEYTYFVSLFGSVYDYCQQYFQERSAINNILNMLIFNILFIALILIFVINIKSNNGLG